MHHILDKLTNSRIADNREFFQKVPSEAYRILRTYSKDIFTISEHFMEVTFRFADAVQNVAVKDKGNANPQLTERQKYIYNAIAASTPNGMVNGMVNGTVNGTVNAPLLATLLDIPLRTIKRELYFLRDNGLIRHVGSDKTGHWEIVR